MKLCALLSIFLLTACENPVTKAVRNAEYSGYEIFGVEKRDLLKRRIADTREDENQAAETLKDSLKELRKIYDLPETQLSRQYDVVQSSFKRSEQRANDVHSSREKMETVANDLFNEWKGEIGEIKSPELKESSKNKLATSEKKFAEMDRGLVAAEKSLEPVLSKLKDQMLYLKHGLNAESLQQLKKESKRIQGEVDSLLVDMRKAIAKSDEFIKSMQ